MMMSRSHEDYYQKLSLPAIPPPSHIKTTYTTTNKRFQKYQPHETEKQLRDIIDQIDSNEFQEKLKSAMDKIVLSWTERHDALIDALDELERSKKRLEHRFYIQQQHLEKYTRESQLYKVRYDNLLIGGGNSNYHLSSSSTLVAATATPGGGGRRRSILSSSNASCLSGKSCTSKSSSSSMRTSFSLVDELIEPIVFFDQHNLHDSDDGNNEFDLYSVLSDPDSFTLPNSSYMTPVMSSLSLKSSPLSTSGATAAASENPNNLDGSSTTTIITTTTAESSTNNSVAAIIPPSQQQQTLTSPLSAVEEEALTFACGEGFWKTIARGKANKAEVDILISNYIRRGGNPNVAKNSDTVKMVKEGYGLIHALIAVKNTSALKRILDAGAKINVYPLTSKREDKLTPLMLAAKLGYMKGVRLLVEQYGSIHLLNQSRGPYGENALHAAVQSGSDEMAAYILRKSQNSLLEKADNNGATPLHYACITGKTRLITLFIRDCAGRPDPRDNKGETPLHYAVRNRKLKVIAKLVGELGVYPNPYILKQVPTPLDLAKQGGLKTIAEYLKSVGAKTTKEMEKTSHVVHSSNSSTFSDESTTSSSTNDSQTSPSASSTAVVGVRQYLRTKTSQILRGTSDR